MLLPIFLLSSFFSAFLLFSAQPFIAKLILPTFGGSPAVWNTAMVFYQGCLLAGYAWVHFGSRRLGLNVVFAVNIVLAVISAFLFLPVAFDINSADVMSDPALTLLLALLGSVGLPFFLVSCNAPLLQLMYSRTTQHDRDNPYFLYAASNLGSLLSLLAYPFLFEPGLSTVSQNALWQAGFVVLALMLVACVVFVRSPIALKNSYKVEKTDYRGEDIISWRRKVGWLVCSALPSALLVATTSHITTDIAAFPLLWVLPLFLYLLTFVLVFSRQSHRIGVVNASLCFSVLAVLTLALKPLTGFNHAPVMVLLSLLTLFMAALVLHKRLVDAKPDVTELTTFYFFMSLGGLLGGVVVALLSPLVFAKVFEFHLILVACLLALPVLERSLLQRLKDRWTWFLVGALLLYVISCGFELEPSSRALYVFMFALSMVYFAGRPVFQSVVLATLIVPFLGLSKSGQELFADRSFYGAYVVNSLDGQRQLLHGTTLHGAQFEASERAREPLTYYHKAHAMGDIMRSLQQTHPASARLAVVGLGSGAMACHARSQDSLTFFEIDPLVVRLSTEHKLFTYLARCAPDARVVEGDARLTLQKESDRSFDLLVLDAFSSDAIPVHIMTREAMNIYQRTLSATGLLVFHISNRHLDLLPVVSGLAATSGMSGWRNDCPLSEQARLNGATPAVYVVLSHLPGIPGISDSSCWKPLDAKRLVHWTDDYSNLLGVLR